MLLVQAGLVNCTNAATHLRFWACVAFRLTEVNPHALSLADLQFMCIPGLRSEARLANLVFSLVSTDYSLCPHFQNQVQNALLAMLHLDQPT